MGDLVSMRQKVEARVRKAMPDNGSGDGIDQDFIMQCLGRNELGDGELYKKLHRGSFVYNNSMNSWMYWKGHSWAVDKLEGRALAAAEAVARVYRAEARRISVRINEEGIGASEEKVLKAVRDSLNKRVNSLRAARRRKNCLYFARTTDDPLAIDGSEMDQKAHLLPCQNGVLNLYTGELEPGRQDDYLMKASPVEWQGIDAPCPVWEKTLLEIFSDKESLADFLRRVCGYAMMGEVVDNILVVLHGQGRNGKSMIVETVSEIMGELAQPVRSEMLLEQYRLPSSSGPNPDIMKLRGLRMAFASETDDGCKISVSKVKWLTGKDKLTGRGIYEVYEVTFKPSHTLFLLTNHKPHAPADDFALWERMLLFPFDLSFVDREPNKPNERRADLYLFKKLEKEYSGILAWLVRGCLEWQKNGLQPPTVVKDAVRDYRRDEDSVGDFIDEMCVVGPGYRVKAVDVYSAFEEWWKENVSNRVPKKKRFGQWFGKRFDRVKSGTIWYEGVGLRADIEADDPMFNG